MKIASFVCNSMILAVIAFLGIVRFAQAQEFDVSFPYTLAPSDVLNNTTVNNQARMGSVESNRACTEIGAAPSGSKCEAAGDGGALVIAAQDLHDALVLCVNNGVDLLGAPMTNGSVCIAEQLRLKNRYAEELITGVVAYSVSNARAQGCYQCVGLVQGALLMVNIPPGGWGWGSNFWDKPPQGYERVTNGIPKAGDIFTYGRSSAGEVGHVGVVKSVVSNNQIIALDANAFNKGGVSIGGGTCDVSDSHQIYFTPGDISGAGKQPRFLRKIGSAEAGGSEVVTQLKTRYGIDMNGFDNAHLQWALEVLGQAPKKFIDLAHGGTMNTQQPIKIAAKNYSQFDPYSEQKGCSGTQLPAHIALIQNFPGSDTEKQEIFKITLIHELGHMIEQCAGNQSMKSRLPQVIGVDGSRLTYYSQNVQPGQTNQGCPPGYPINEDYAEMMTYHINSNLRTKNVCGNGRDANPYSYGGNFAHKSLVREILGQ